MKKYLFLSILSTIFSSQIAKAQDIPEQWHLSTCIDYALQENIQIKKSKLILEESLVDSKTARAALFPNLSFSTSQNYVNQPMLKDASGEKNSYSGSYGLNASWTIWNGGKRLKTIEQQKLNDRIAELDINQSENSIEESITQLFLQILYAVESVKTNENTLEVSLAQCDRAKEMLAVGSIARSDYAQLESQYSNDKYQLVTSQATLKDYKLQLKQLLELDGEEEMNLILPAIDNSEVLTPLPGKTEVYNTALLFRPEIQSSKLNLEASNLDINIARSSYLPTLSMSAGLGTGHSSGNDFTFSEQLKNRWNESVGLTLSVPIFNNRQTKSAVQKAKLFYEDSKLNLINEQKNLFKTIESLWLDANSSQERFAAAQEKLRSSQISYDLVSEQFNLGLKNTVELLTEKNNLLSAQQEVLQAKYMAVLSIQLLRFYQGEKITL